MIVVTGATGNVGRTLVRTLAAAGHAVTAVSRHIQDADVPAGVRAVAADLGTPAGLKDAQCRARRPCSCWSRATTRPACWTRPEGRRCRPGRPGLLARRRHPPRRRLRPRRALRASGRRLRARLHDPALGRTGLQRLRLGRADPRPAPRPGPVRRGRAAFRGPGRRRRGSRRGAHRGRPRQRDVRAHRPGADHASRARGGHRGGDRRTGHVRGDDAARRRRPRWHGSCRRRWSRGRWPSSASRRPRSRGQPGRRAGAGPSGGAVQGVGQRNAAAFR